MNCRKERLHKKYSIRIVTSFLIQLINCSKNEQGSKQVEITLIRVSTREIARKRRKYTISRIGEFSGGDQEIKEEEEKYDIDRW